MKIIAFAISLCTVVAALMDNNDIQKARQYARLAIEAYKEKNYASSLEYLKQAIKLRPDHPTLLYNLAGVNSLLHNSKESIALLQHVAKMGLIYAPEKDTDFASLRNLKEFQGIVGQFQQNRQPVGKPSTAFKFKESDLITEGLAFDPVSGSLFVGSVRKRQILKIDKNGRVSEFSQRSDGLWGVFGMKVDPERKTLWVCTSAIPQMDGYKEEDKSQAAVCKYDLASSKLIKRYELADHSRPHLFGDLTLNSRGDVFITDSQSPMIFMIRAKSDTLELFMQSASFVSLQGLDCSRNGSRLFVSDYARGIFLIDMLKKEASLLPTLLDATFLSIDGLYRYKNGFIATQNDINPRRVVRLRMDDDFKKIIKVETLVANHEYSDPTLGVIVEDEFFFNANGQWDAFDEKGALRKGKQLKEHVILRVKL